MSRTDKNLSQIISEAQISILDSNESVIDDKGDDSASSMKDILLAKCRDTIESLYAEIENQKRQRREAELLCRENETKLQGCEKRLKDSNSRLLELREANERLTDLNSELKKSAKSFEKSSATFRINDELQDEIISLKHAISEKSQSIQDLNSSLKTLDMRSQRLEYENTRLKEELEESLQKIEDLQFKCERLSNQSKISETVTQNLKQAQEDYQSYLRDEKEKSESREKELKEKYEQMESKMKKRFQSKELQLKQEVNQSIEDILRSVEINDSEHAKVRLENISLKESIKSANENFGHVEQGLREQIEKLEAELNSCRLAGKEKAGIIERIESMQKFERNKLESALAREKELETCIKALEDKVKVLEGKVNDAKKTVEGLNNEIYSLKSDLSKESNKLQAKEIEVKELVDGQRDLLNKIGKLKDERQEDAKNYSVEIESKVESTAILTKQQLQREFELKLEDYKGKISELHAENKTLKLKFDQKSSELSKIKEKDRDSSRIFNFSAEESIPDEIYSLKQQLSKIHKQKSSAEQKYTKLKDDYLCLEDKIKQDSSFFRNETLRKDEELTRLKKKFETKLREIYAETSLITEQLRTDLLKLNNDIRSRDTKDNCVWISRNIEDMMKRIPSY